MSEEKQLIKQEERKELSEKDIQLLISANVLPKDIPKEMVAFFMAFCKQTNLNPFKRQVYIVPRFSKTKGMTYTIQTGIDGYRAIADRTGLYAGNDDAVYDNEEKPTRATVTVYKMVHGIRCLFTATARWEQYYPSNETAQFIWNKMPHLMLGKCAEALALRKAFPNELSGTYTDEEMQQANTIDINSQIEEPKKNGSSPKETKGVEQSSTTYSKELICSKCEIPIKSNIADYSSIQFGKMLCWEHQQEEKEFQKAGKSPEQQKIDEYESAMEDETI